MRRIDDLIDEIQRIGFSCRRCGACCTGDGAGSDLVLLSPAEVRAACNAAALPRDEVAEPYPESIDGPDGTSCTFGWSYRRQEGHCRFLDGTRCTIYDARSWICRTYPFMLDGDRLCVSECPGLGAPMTRDEAAVLACDLLARQAAEREEEDGVGQVYACSRIPPGASVVIDSEGVWTVHG
ncbi:YkgJ family cysteine cluster protein [Methanofollis fontis]|uniref:YkgJ family cysteine cluster protein n=1 Tax=Methanofollis fontis TaxID=2052832 RepID=A0A483CNK3_9EURY|nr:YkgJ family cysteine cluster protein [Methanofollis fontis]TAJ44192.1 YkgJ family cysteine cluster protein [Methanofollis fontis]